jgi:anthranilate phosphoribosyltransferase
MRDLLLKLCNRQDLTREESRHAFSMIMSGEASEAQIGALLVGLASKGTTIDELVGAAIVMREKANRIDVGCDPSADVVLDTCGDGRGRARDVQHLHRRRRSSRQRRA